jgi:tRNA(Ile)-lysidine synthase
VARVRRPPAVARVLERVTATVRAHEMLEPGDLVLVGVSGGPDSVCLLHSLWHLRRLFKIRLAVFHFDHRLRPDSGDDAMYIRRVASRLGLDSHLRIAEDAPRRGESVEFWARYARTRAWGETAKAIGATRLADGHTQDDQAETVLLALAMGWGLDGLSGIPPKNGILVRPLLDVARGEVEAFCKALGLRPRIDPTNADTRRLRNAIRLEVLPAIERATGRNVRPTFSRTAELLRSDADVLWRDADERASSMVEMRPEGFRVKVSKLAGLPRSVASRVVRRGFQLADIGWTKDAIEGVVDLASGRPGRRLDLVMGSKAWRDKVYVHVARPSPDRRSTDGGGSA